VIAIAGFLLYHLITGAGWFLGHAVAGSTKTVQQHVHDSVNAKTNPVAARHQSFADSPDRDEPDPVEVLGDTPDDTNDVVCTGYTILGKDVTVFFSDGSTAYGDAGEVQKIESHWVTAFGRRYRIIVGRAVSPALEIDSSFSQRGRGLQIESPDAYISQGQVSEPAPVNDAEILPSINSQASGIPPTPRINGVSAMRSNFQPQPASN